MRRILWMSGVMAVCLVAPGLRMQAQDAAAGGGQGGGRRGGFGQMGAPVQGTVTAVTAKDITLKTDAGDTYDVTLSDTARIMENRQAIQLTNIKPGDSVTAFGTVDAAKKTVVAMMVNATDAATMAKAKENLGKTYITGKVAAIDADNLKITVTRTDAVSQVIAVDDGTSFQRGTRGVAADVTAAGGLAMGGGFGGGRGGGGRGGQGGAQGAAPPAPESITLADIKVGDELMATGTMKSGTFTVLKMGVQTPGMGGGGRRGQGGPNAPAGPSPAGAPAAPPQ